MRWDDVRSSETRWHSETSTTNEAAYLRARSWLNQSFLHKFADQTDHLCELHFVFCSCCSFTSGIATVAAVCFGWTLNGTFHRSITQWKFECSILIPELSWTVIENCSPICFYPSGWSHVQHACLHLLTWHTDDSPEFSARGESRKRKRMQRDQETGKKAKKTATVQVEIGTTMHFMMMRIMSDCSPLTTCSVGYSDTLGTREKCHSIQLSL